MPAINWLSVFLAALIPMLLGFVWYHEKVFGTAWMKATGITKEDAKKANMGVMLGISFLMSLITAWYLLFNVDGFGQEGTAGEFDTFKHGAFHGAMLGIMIGMPLIITNGLFEMRKWSHMWINVGYWILCFTLMGGVLDMMNHFPADMSAH